MANFVRVKSNPGSQFAVHVASTVLDAFKDKAVKHGLTLREAATQALALWTATQTVASETSDDA